MIIEYEGTNYDLKKMHTKQLLNLIRTVNKGPYCDCCHSWDFLMQHMKYQNTLLSFIKEELATREHIPNKIEAKAIRKQKAIVQKNKHNRKYRNR